VKVFVVGGALTAVALFAWACLRVSKANDPGDL